MATATSTIPAARKSRRRWYFAAFVVLFVTTPVAYYFVAGWLRDRELDALYHKMDVEDPHWRWPDLVAQLPAPPPDDQNAAVQALKVRDLLKATPFTEPRWKGKGKTPMRLPADHVAAVRANLGKLGPDVVKEARKLKDFPEGRFRIEAVENPLDSATTPLVDHMGVLNVMRVLHYDSKLRASDGDIEDAAESCQGLLNTVHAFDGAPGLLSLLVSAAGQEMTVDGLERTLTHGTVSARRLLSLQAALVREDDNDGMYQSLRSERAMFHQYYLMVQEGKAPAHELQMELASNTPFSRGFANILPAVFAGSYAESLRARNEQVWASKLRDQERIAAFAAVAKNYENVRSVLYLTSMLCNDLPKTQTRVRCAITALAAERFRLEHGQCPDSAEQLVKRGWLKKVYVDPEDGQPLSWKRTPTGIVISANVRAGVSFELSRPVVDKK